MKNTNHLCSLGFSCLLGLAMASLVQAVPINYIGAGNSGVNPTTYTFTAANTGPVIAYFVGQTAGYGSKVGMSVNGAAVDFGDFGLQNHAGTSIYGASFTMGNVNAGDIIRFLLAVDINNGAGPLTAGDVDYYVNSDPTLNPLGENFIYSYAYAGDPGGTPIPAGIYVGFEDSSPLANGDRDYDDHQFVFTNIGSTSTTVPEGGSTLFMMGLATLGITVLGRRMK